MMMVVVVVVVDVDVDGDAHTCVLVDHLPLGLDQRFSLVIESRRNVVPFGQQSQSLPPPRLVGRSLLVWWCGRGCDQPPSRLRATTCVGSLPPGNIDKQGRGSERGSRMTKTPSSGWRSTCLAVAMRRTKGRTRRRPCLPMEDGGGGPGPKDAIMPAIVGHGREG
ncbi:hypothetical protein LZ30DRAFT_268211 [Colletotrichum cereale]|nr:hypothetical protein LZ30DRAFT_268211 [Colletotrichum cereale]